MSRAAAQQAAQGFQNIRSGGVGILLNVGISVEHGTADAITAMHGLFGDESLLDGMRTTQGTEAFYGGNGMIRAVGYSSDAGTNGLSVEQHGAGAALAQAAPELGPVQLEVLLENIKQWRVRIVHFN